MLTTHIRIDARGDYSDVAVLIPCYNEESTIAKVVHDFREHLPGAQILVFDNNSSDKSAALARGAGALVQPSPRQGKGYVVRHMFRDNNSPLAIMVDADDTYPAKAAPQLIKIARLTKADMVVGTRLQDHHDEAFRRFHSFGNRLVAKLISFLFKARVTDVLSGYRVFSLDFMRMIPLTSQGFEIETEMTLQALAKNLSLKEVPVKYAERPRGSQSKLNTYSDGWLILKSIFTIFKHYKPMIFFSSFASGLGLASIAFGVAPILDYFDMRFVEHVPSAILAAALAILSLLSFGIGLILDSVIKYHNENFALMNRNFYQQNGRLQRRR